jgi:hypothetical protein
MRLLSKILKFFGSDKNNPQKQQKTGTTQTPPVSVEEKQTSAEEAKIRQAIEGLTFHNLEQNENFYGVIPLLHKHTFALGFISKNNELVDFYTNTILKINNGSVPLEIEEAIIKSKYTILLYAFQSKGVKWSKNAEDLMLKHHPTTYYHFFKPF